MNIGIIGSGNIGGTLTRGLSALGHDVAVANSRGPQSLADLAAETGATAGTVETAARESDVVVLAVPLRVVPDLPTDAFRGKIVVDANNYYTGRDGRIAEIADGSRTSSRWTSDLLRDATVVKAFNTMFAQHLLEKGLPPGTDGRIALPVAGDDDDAKRVVMGLVDELGFDPVDAGGLDDSWRQEPGTAVAGAETDTTGLREALASAHR